MIATGLSSAASLMVTAQGSHKFKETTDFIYIKDERYGELPDEIKKAIRTGSWYRRSSPDEAWPLDEDDEDMLMERDPLLEEPWRYFEDVDDFLAYEAEVAEKKTKSELCAGLGCRDGECRQACCDDETLAKAREICTMPHGADPAETFVMDILADQVGTLLRGSTMQIRFFLPEELFWKKQASRRRWLSPQAPPLMQHVPDQRREPER